MKLFYSPGACSLSPHIVAREAGLAVGLEKVDLVTHKTANGGDYFAINPKGYVPALLLNDGQLLTEGPAIVQYLADLKPDSNLLAPTGELARYRAVEWLTYINSEIHKTFHPLFTGASDTQKQETRDTLKRRFAYVGEKLGGNDYLTGKIFTVADAYLYVTLRWARKMHIELPDNLVKLAERITARPAVHTALKEES